MIRKIKAFHEKNMEQYRKDIQEHMEPWKEKVMKLHEEADFLFYVDEMDIEMSKGLLTLRGDVVKGEQEVGKPLMIYNGEGKAISTAILHSQPEEKEEKRLGILRHKRNEFQVKLVSIRGKKLSDMEEEVYQKALWDLELTMSLITDYAVFRKLR